MMVHVVRSRTWPPAPAALVWPRGQPGSQACLSGCASEPCGRSCREAARAGRASSWVGPPSAPCRDPAAWCAQPPCTAHRVPSLHGGASASRHTQPGRPRLIQRAHPARAEHTVPRGSPCPEGRHSEARPLARPSHAIRGHCGGHGASYNKYWYQSMSLAGLWAGMLLNHHGVDQVGHELSLPVRLLV